LDQIHERPVVAVLGMGKMGHALAGRLLDQEWSVRLWNRSPRDLSGHQSRGAVQLESLEELWDHAQVVVTFLANDDALADVCFGSDSVLGPGPAGRTLIDMSTVSPRLSREIATRAAAVGVDYLRSPVSGNPAVLAAGNITLLVSGPRDTFDRAEDLLSSIGPTVLYIGDADQSRTLKLAINSGLAITAQVMAELIVLAENNGIERSVLLHALGESVMGSPFVRYKTPGLIAHDYSATFTTNLLAKDLDLALDVAHGADLSLPMIELASTLTKLASANGYGEIDVAALLPSLQLTLGMTPDVAPSAQ
jgi:3-hydroxyisobutyrate dehydrogenase-like beta-hydroxyacid dehydrogenase